MRRASRHGGRFTLARYDDLRLTLIAIRAGEHIRTHATAARITVQTVAGHVRMHAGDRLQPI